MLVHADMASPHLEKFGMPDQFDRYMPDIIAGRKVSAVAVSEPGGGSDVQALETRAERQASLSVPAR